MYLLTKMYFCTNVCAFVILMLNTCAVDGVPGAKSIRHCHKLYNLKFTLQDLDYFEPMTTDDLRWIQKEESNESIPTWVFNPYEDISHYYSKGSFPAYGGVDAFNWQYPFMAALGFGNLDDIEYNCGGTLISEEFVITAAHCVIPGQRGPVKYVRLGDVDIRLQPNKQLEIQILEVSTYYIHPNYTYEERYNDIALIKLAKPAAFTKFVKPICLEYERKNLRYKRLYAAGWGLLGYGENRSNILQEVTLRQHTIASCQKTYANDRKLPIGVIDDVQICVGGLVPQNITDTCEGDSGGPLLYPSKRFERRVNYLTGITSFGVQCGIAPLPAVYTRVAYYIDWIENIVWSNENK